MTTTAEYPRTVAAVKAAETTSQWSIGDALVAEIGPPGKPGEHDGSAKRFEACAAELERNGVDFYKADTLRNMRNTAAAFPPERRLPAVTFWAHNAACDPDTLDRVVEAIVTAAVLERLDGPGLAQAQAGHDDDDDAETVAEVERLARKLEEYVEMFAADEMTRAAYVKATRAADAALKAARRRLGKRHASDALDGIGNLRADWEGLSDDRRREVLAAVLERVTIAPASRPSGAGFDADRIAVTWTA